MVMSGRKPSDRPTVTRHKPTVDWTEVPSTPFAGVVPALPDVREIVNKAGDITVHPIPAQTLTWYASVTSMPHCVLWSPSDWAFCLDTALIHAQAVTGVVSAMSELRQREKIMGTTVDSRRDLRIRYVELEDEVATLAPVDNIDDRRQRLLNA
jgi:hypothetical protein